MSASAEITGGKDEDDFCHGVDISENGVQDTDKRKQKHALPNMEHHKYHRLKKKYVLLVRSTAKLRHHMKKQENENDKLRANFLDLQQSSAQVIQRKDVRIQELTDQLQQYINKFQKSHLVNQRDHARRSSHDLACRSHHSQSPDDRGHLRHAVMRREKRTREGSSDRGDSREKRRREDDHHLRHRQADVTSHQKSYSRLGDVTAASSRGHRDCHQYRSSSRHSGSPRCDIRQSDSHGQSPSVATDERYNSDPDVGTPRAQHNTESDREHGRFRDDSRRNIDKKQDKDRTDIRVKTPATSLPHKQLTVGQQEATEQIEQSSTQQMGISDKERMRAYISMARKRTLVQQIAYKNGQQLRNQLIANYTTRSVDHANYIASLPKARDEDANRNLSSLDGETSCKLPVNVLDDSEHVAHVPADCETAKSSCNITMMTPSMSSFGTSERLVNDELSTKKKFIINHSANVAKDRKSGHTDTKDDNTRSQEMLFLDGLAGLSNKPVVRSGYDSIGSMRTARDVAETNPAESRVVRDASAPLGMLLSVLKQTCTPSQQTHRPIDVHTTQSPPVAKLLNMLFGKTISRPLAAGDSTDRKECTASTYLPNTDVTVAHNLQSVASVSCTPSAAIVPCQVIKRDLSCDSSMQQLDEVVKGGSKPPDDIFDSVVPRKDVTPGKKCLRDVTPEPLGDTVSVTTKPLDDVTSAKSETLLTISDVVSSKGKNGDILAHEPCPVMPISHKYERRSADTGRGINKLQSNETIHRLNQKNSSAADENAAALSNLLGSSVKQIERPERNDVVTASDRPFVGSSTASDSSSLLQAQSKAESKTFRNPVNPVEGSIDSIYADDDDEYDDGSDFAFVIDTNVSPVSSDVEGGSVSRKDEDLWDISLQSSNKHARRRTTPTGSPCKNSRKLPLNTDGMNMRNDVKTQAVAAISEVPKAGLHVQDARGNVKSRGHRRPNSTTPRKRSSSDNGKIRSMPCDASKQSSRVSSSKVEQNKGPEKTHRSSDQYRRAQKETCQDLRPIRHHNRPQKDSVWRQGESRNAEGGTVRSAQKAACHNGGITPRESACRVRSARTDTEPVRGVSARQDCSTNAQRTVVTDTSKRSHRSRDDWKKSLGSGGTPLNRKVRSGSVNSSIPSIGNPPNKNERRARGELKNGSLSSFEALPSNNAPKFRNDLKNHRLSGETPTNTKSHHARDSGKKHPRTSSEAQPNKRSHHARDDLKKHLPCGETPPMNRTNHTRDDVRKNDVISDETTSCKIAPDVRADVKNLLATAVPPASQAVVDDALDNDTPACTEGQSLTERQEDSMEEGEILSDEDKPSTTADGLHSTHGHGTSKERQSRHGCRRR